MKKILGKTVWISILLSLSLWAAGVKATLSTPAITRGESVTLTLTAEGSDVTFPTITEVEGFPILSTSSSQSTTIINGTVSKRLSRLYRFSPTHTVTIPAYTVEIDGQKYQTQPLKLAVLKPSASPQGSDFLVEMKVDKKVAHVGEAINLTVLFKQKHNAQAAKLQLSEPKLENFWIKKVEGVTQEQEGAYLVQKVHYILFPQKAGTYTLDPIEAAIGKRVRSRRSAGGMFDDPFFNDPFFDAFSNRLRWKKIYSNTLTLDIKPLPGNLELYGNFQIHAMVDKRKVQANKPVNLSITVTGEGNIDDIKKFDLSLNNVVVYADEPRITTGLTGDSYGGEFSQKIALIADRNYTIPPVSLTYVDAKTQQVKTIQTQPIAIEVEGGGATAAASTAPKVEVAEEAAAVPTPKAEAEGSKPRTTEKSAAYTPYLFLLVGFVLGIVLTLLATLFANRGKKREHDIIKQIKKAKTDQALFDLLLPYAKKGTLIAETLEKLEENIYKKTKHTVDKNLLMDFFEEEEMEA